MTIFCLLSFCFVRIVWSLTLDAILHYTSHVTICFLSVSCLFGSVSPLLPFFINIFTGFLISSIDLLAIPLCIF